MLKKAKNNLGDDIVLIKKDIFRDYLNRKFDFVVCSGVIGINDSPKKFLMNLNKMKKKDIYIYFIILMNINSMFILNMKISIN